MLGKKYCHCSGTAENTSEQEITKMLAKQKELSYFMYMQFENIIISIICNNLSQKQKFTKYLVQTGTDKCIVSDNYDQCYFN